MRDAHFRSERTTAQELSERRAEGFRREAELRRQQAAAEPLPQRRRVLLDAARRFDQLAKAEEWVVRAQPGQDAKT